MRLRTNIYRRVENLRARNVVSLSRERYRRADKADGTLPISLLIADGTEDSTGGGGHHARGPWPRGV